MGHRRFFRILDNGGFWLDGEDRKLAVDRGELYLVSYQRLSVYYLQRRIKNYKIRPKHHYFACRILLRIQAWGLNYRKVHCFMDEDYMGRIAKIVRCTSGLTTSLRTIQRWILFIAQRWHEMATGALL